MKSNPKILYKYRSLSGESFKFTHDIFMSDELYFPHPDQINDPFDCQIPLSFDGLTKDKLLEEIGTYDFDFNKKQELMERVNNNSIEIIAQGMEQAFKSQKDVGVLSFSEKYSDILMWGHYADSHKGICIGFNYSELSFSFREGPSVPELVKYPEGNEFPKCAPFVDDVKTQIDKIYFTKSSHWEYEQEWRVILPENGETSQKINPCAIVSVYLGCQITEGDRQTILNWCSQRKQKPKVYQMVKDSNSYSLKEEEISY